LKKILLENAWTNHSNQPPNSTLGGVHMTQTTDDFDFLQWANPIRNSPKWSCNGKQWQFETFLLEMLSGMVEIFPHHLFKPQGVVLLNGHSEDYVQG
jgi:hypothetical protein